MYVCMYVYIHIYNFCCYGFTRSAQSGYESITNRLLDAGADGRSHTVTKYSPLYAAVHHGHYNIAKKMLEKFPDLVQVNMEWV